MIDIYDYTIDGVGGSIKNEDETLYEPPENPLWEKWLREYPPMRNGRPCGPVCGYYDDGRPIPNYTCVICHEDKCPYCDDWEVPEEDREEYEKWLDDSSVYFKKHNPNYMNFIEKLCEEINKEGELE